ncbi:MAG: Xaa-Pro aminopeptidase [Legionellales bacterium]|nr:Xaa-Pro aminopeptidase [Legionellales bacterium]
MMSKIDFAARRQQFMQQMKPNSIAILYSGDAIIRSHDSEYRFRVNSDFYYLTGFTEEKAAALLIPGRSEGEFILFNLPRDREKEIWNGRRAGQEGACRDFGANQAFSIDELAEKLTDFLINKETLYFAFGRNTVIENILLNSVNLLRSRVRAGVGAPKEMINIETVLHEMRLYKTPEEIAIIRRACEISAHAHSKAMQVCQPGMFEYQLEAELIYEFTKAGCLDVAYSSIVASGENSCILHYRENNRQIQDGDMVLIDAGCEYQVYASDITRTFPANGRFSKEQQAIYEIVLHTQKTCIEAIKPGISAYAGQERAIKLLTQGLIDVGLLHGELNELIETRAYFQFYMHRLSHWMGMDVHDVGIYQLNNGWRPLAENMIFTVEPGIYISPANNVDEKWWNIGVRIEDDVLVTKNGCDVLTKDVPKSVNEIEILMRS